MLASRAAPLVQQALRESEEKFRSIVETTQEWIWASDLAGVFTYSNPAVQAILGYTPEEVVGVAARSLMHADDRADAEAEAPRRRTEKRGWTGRVVRFRHQDGSYRYLEANAVPILGSGGELLGFRGANRDVTDRKLQGEEASKLAEKARVGEERLAAAQHVAHVGSWEWNVRTGEVLWSDEEFRLLGHSPGAFEPSYERYVASIHPDDREALGAWVNNVLAGKQAAELQNRALWPDDQLRELHHRAAVVLDENGDVLRLVGTSQDVTEQRRAQTELAEALRAANEANRAKSDFLASMSHEIRTPMNGVIGMLGLLLDSKLGADQRDAAQTAQRSAEALLTVINDILDFSKIEAGRLLVEPVPFDLFQATEEVADLLAAEARDRGLDLVLRYAPDAPRHVVGDAGRIRQVLLNLTGNALKFTHSGHVLVEVGCQQVTDGRALMTLSVEDTGVGIPADRLADVFEKFTQVDASSSRRYGGTGLGLAISRQLVELMGGTLEVRSQQGVGSTFTFTLPLDVAADPLPQPARRDDEAAATGRVADAAPAARVGGLAPQHEPRSRVLLAEDHVVNQKVAMRILQKLGCRVDLAVNGAEAVTMVDQFPYDLVFMDCQMPEMDGYEATAEIRRRGNGRRLPIVAMTAHAMAGDRERCLAAGMDDYLSKPVRVELVAAALERWLPAPDPTEELLDPRAIARLRAMAEGEDDGFLREVAELFAQTASESITSLEQAISAGELAAVAEAAHRLGGAARNMGALKLADLCSDAEHRSDALDWPGARHTFGKLRIELDRVSEAMERLR